MIQAIRKYLWFLCTCLIIIASSWYYSGTKSKIKLDPQSLALTPDLYVHALSVKKYDAKGILVNELHSPFVQHFPKDDSHLMEKPRIWIAQADQSTMNIESQTARAIRNGEEITFIDDVTVHQNPGNDKPVSTMKTEKIIYKAKDRTASTDLPVRFEQGGDTIHSTGMIAWLSEKRIKLLNQARGRYAPKDG